ncbi:MAG TPA: GGDEF domain-containing protein [Solirubrobacterales bacterium]|nr:GGDEF domain-containing protein [Solirubrobacterales bacterium]
MARRSESENGSGGSPAGRLAREVSSLQATLLGKLEAELQGAGAEEFAAAAARLAEDFGAVAATVVDAAYERATAGVAQAESGPATNGAAPETAALESLFHPGHMRRRLDQLVETHRRYGHPFALVVFDASGPGTRAGDVGGGQETVLSVVGAALRDSLRIVDEVYRLEEDALCVLAPNLRTVEGVQMAERLLTQLDELERAGGLRIAISAGVVACPEHGAEAELLLHKADAAMWRARAVGQPVGVGALEPERVR